jgi:hypothetical protein
MLAKSIGVFELLRFDTSHGELRLDEAEPDRWFLFIIGTQLDLCLCHGKFTNL